MGVYAYLIFETHKINGLQKKLQKEESKMKQKDQMEKSDQEKIQDLDKTIEFLRKRIAEANIRLDDPKLPMKEWDKAYSDMMKDSAKLSKARTQRRKLMNAISGFDGNVSEVNTACMHTYCGVAPFK